MLLESNKLEFWQNVLNEYTESLIWSHLCHGSAEFNKVWPIPIEKANIQMLAKEFINVNKLSQSLIASNHHYDLLFCRMTWFSETVNIRNNFIKYCINKFSK